MNRIQERINITPSVSASPPRLARRTQTLRSNVIRDMLRAASQPDVISLGGGNPAQESFPSDEMPALMKDVMARYASSALQYSDTQGFLPLREALASWLRAQNIAASPENLVITSGSQSALDILAKMLIDEHSPVIGEQPTYLGALQAFSLFNPNWHFLEEDAQGPLLKNLAFRCGKEGGPKTPLLYVMPTFRNPTGSSWSHIRLDEVANALEGKGSWIIEDDPYRLLCYEDAPPAPLKNRLPAQTIYLGTLSKVFAPGLRLGYCLVPDPLLPWVVKTKQGTDLNTGTLAQALAAEYIASGRLNDNLPGLVAIYRAKRNVLAAAIQKQLPPEFSFHLPEGGMFLWVKGPPGFDSERFLAIAIQHGVFFVPGAAFFDDRAGASPSNEHRRCMRLNFSGPALEQLDEAAKRLAKAIEMYRRQ